MSTGYGMCTYGAGGYGSCVTTFWGRVSTFFSSPLGIAIIAILAIVAAILLIVWARRSAAKRRQNIQSSPSNQNNGFTNLT